MMDKKKREDKTQSEKKRIKRPGRKIPKRVNEPQKQKERVEIETVKKSEKTEKPKRPMSSAGRKKPASDPKRKNPNVVSQRQVIEDKIRLNKYIAHAGLCSRRDADEYISQGKVKVNGKVITELGTKIKKTDDVQVEKQDLSLEPFVYILLNKGRDTICTTDDEKGRRTVMDIIENATGQRVYPVGRLDRNTEGLLLLSNDGDLAHRLMHPSYKVKKTYVVNCSRSITDEELIKLSNDVNLEDGPVKPVSVKRAVHDPKVLEISVYEGRNHLIRRMIGFLGADVVKLQRTQYGGLTDKDLRIGRWRFLKQNEINNLRKLVKLDTLDFKKNIQ